MTKAHRQTEAEIIDHIHSIFTAFINQDRDKLRETHTKDWMGFLGPSTQIERGIDAYMENAEISLSTWKGTSYKLIDTEVKVYGQIALVFYVAEYQCVDHEGTEFTIPLRSIDIYRQASDGWIQAGSHITVIPSGGNWGEGDR